MSERFNTSSTLDLAPVGTCQVGPGHESAAQAAAVAAAEAIAATAAAEVASEAAATARAAVRTASAAAATAAARASIVAAEAVSAASAAAAEAALENALAVRSGTDEATAAAPSDLFGTAGYDLGGADEVVATSQTATNAAATAAAKAADTVAAAVAAVATAAAKAVVDAAALIEGQLGRDVAATADAVDRATAVTSAQTLRSTSPGGTGRTTSTPAVETAEQAMLERLLAERAVRTVFQPLVSLGSGQVLGYEALSRGPAGTALERPDLMFAAARRGRRLRDLDIACRTAALTAAGIAGLTDPYRLFINAEPEALEGWRPHLEHEHLPLTVVLELTERALTSQPAQLLQTVAWVRALGWGIALDDVGANPASLALLPLVQPDVIKLDLALVQNPARAHVAAVVNAVHAEAERSGTVVLAEGIETAEHLRTARAFGATVGQGWYFGRPGPLPTPLPTFAAAAPLPVVPRRAGTDDPSPFNLAAVDRPVRDADKRMLLEISKQLETMAHAAGDSAIVLAAFQDATFFTPATRRRYTGLVRSCSFVAALGQGMPAEPLPGLRGAVIRPGDPLLGEWDIAVLGPHFAGCLVARDLGDTGPDMTRRFEFILSHDRELTIRVAASLMSRVRT